jgi:hypothetical protein
MKVPVSSTIALYAARIERTAEGALGTVGRKACVEKTQVLLGARQVRGAECAPDTVNITVQLHIAYILDAQLCLTLARRSDLFARAASETSAFLEAIDILGV